MIYQIRLTTGAHKSINNLPKKISDAALEFIYSSLAQNPYRIDKPLHGKWEGYHSARRSSYRIVYQITDETLIVHIVKVAYRADAYH